MVFWACKPDVHKEPEGGPFLPHPVSGIDLLGSLSTAGIVWSVQDCMLGLLIIPNVLALLKLSPVVMKLTAEFFRENHK